MEVRHFSRGFVALRVLLTFSLAQTSWSAWRPPVRPIFPPPFSPPLNSPPTSDNVVRAGLTPKLRDVPTLTSMLTYTSSPPWEQILPPVGYKSTSFTTLYDPPIDEFSVLLTDLPAGKTETFPAIEGPSILIFTQLGGEARVRVEGEKEIVVVREGQVFFVGAGRKVIIDASKGGVAAYRAFVEV